MSSTLVTVHPDDTYRKAVELLTQHRLTGLPVTDRMGRLLGILSEKDILLQCSSFDRNLKDFLDSRIQFKAPVRSVKLDTPLDRVGEILAGKSFRHLPVVDNEGVIRGIITRRDLIRILYLRIELAKGQRGTL